MPSGSFSLSRGDPGDAGRRRGIRAGRRRRPLRTRSADCLFGEANVRRGPDRSGHGATISASRRGVWRGRGRRYPGTTRGSSSRPDRPTPQGARLYAPQRRPRRVELRPASCGTTPWGPLTGCCRVVGWRSFRRLVREMWLAVAIRLVPGPGPRSLVRKRNGPRVRVAAPAA